MNCLLTLLLVTVFISKSLCAKILFLPMHMTASHKLSMMPLANALVENGHHVTFWNAFFEAMPIKTANKEIVDHDLVLTSSNNIYNEQWVWHNGTDIMDTWNSVDIKSWNMFIIYSLGTDICKHAIEQHSFEINQLIKENFDLMIVDTLFCPCGMLIAERSGVPKMLFSTSYSMPFTNRHISNPQPIDAYPAITINYDKQNFWHRVQQFFSWYVFDIFCAQVVQWSYRWMLIELWPASFDWKQFDESSLYHFNSAPITINDPNPYLLDTFSSGDTTCPNAPDSKLPERYKDFVEDLSSKGTIIAAFGHIVNWSMAPRSDIMALYDAFKQLADYRIIWQYDGAALPELPNLLLTSWIPQKELLYHSNTKLFISHMGLKSVLEGLCAEVPFAALPVYAEQPFNARMLINRHKTGIILDKKHLKVADIVEKLKQVLENPMYKAKVSNLREIMIDRIKNPIDDAAIRLDFALKHKDNAAIWRIRGRTLNFLTYYNLDIAAMIVLVCISLPILTKKLYLHFS